MDCYKEQFFHFPLYPQANQSFALVLLVHSLPTLTPDHPGRGSQAFAIRKKLPVTASGFLHLSRPALDGDRVEGSGQWLEIIFKYDLSSFVQEHRIKTHTYTRSKHTGKRAFLIMEELKLGGNTLVSQRLRF